MSTFPVWAHKLIDRVNANGDHGVTEILDYLPLFQRAGVLTHDSAFLQALQGLVDLREAQLRPTDTTPDNVPSDTRKLGKNEFLVPVSYTRFPSFAELEQEFGKGNFSTIFDGKPFHKHSSCANTDETSGYKTFLVKHFNREIMSEDAIAEMDKLGYRPATHIEAYSFQKAKPELQLQFWIVALGSFAVVGGGQYVAVLDSNSGTRVFYSDWFVGEWRSDRRFLFVRK